MSDDRPLAVILISGGVDSAACVAFLRASGYRLLGFYVDYGHVSRRQEMAAIGRLKQRLLLPISVCTVDPGRQSGAGEVQGRNAFLIMTALLCAPPDTAAIAIGIHRGAPYYDCSPLFFQRMRDLVEEYTNGRTSVLAPFLNWSRADILQYADRTDVPLDLTYSCEQGLDPPCGRCLSCKDRARY